MLQHPRSASVSDEGSAAGETHDGGGGFRGLRLRLTYIYRTDGVRPLNCCKEKAEAAEALEPLAKGEAEEGADDEQLAAGI